jgi:hypothetical protein
MVGDVRRRMIQKLIFATCLLCFSVYCLATPQADDSLLFEGREGFIVQNPISAVVEKKKANFVVTCSTINCGYTASWGVSNGGLYLTSFEAVIERRFLFWTYTREVGLQWLFSKSRGPVLADWYTGEIHLNLGNVVLSDEEGFFVATEEMIVFTINNGKVKKTSRLKYPKNVPVINKWGSALLGEPFDIRKINTKKI